MLTYQTLKNIVRVYLDDKHVGNILEVSGGVQYFPKGQKTGGEVYPTLSACKKSLAGDE